MLDILKFVIFFSIFSVAIFIGNYIVLTAIKVCFKINIKLWLYALVIAVVFALLMLFGRNFFYFIRVIILDYLGLLSIATTVSLVVLLCNYINKFVSIKIFDAKLFAIAGTAITALLVVIATYNYHKAITIEQIQVATDKVSSDYKIVHIGDTQLGTTSQSRFVYIMRSAYNLKPDFIVMTGDLVDAATYDETSFNILQESPAPIYFIRGNHELYHDAERLQSYLDKIDKLHTLKNSQITAQEIIITGVDYDEKVDNVATQLNKLPIDTTKYNIFLYHKPAEVEAALEFGYDLLLYGHTHAGQIFPWTLLIDWLYDYGDGLFVKANQIIYTTDGASLWGPRMRLGSQNEIVMINIKAQN